MTMCRYVDIDKVEWNKHYLAISNGKVVQETLQVDADYLNKLVEDVAPVIHAHWIENEDCSVVTDIPWSMCAACGSYSPKLLYCAFCGAKMDEEV